MEFPVIDDDDDDDSDSDDGGDNNDNNNNDNDKNNVVQGDLRTASTNHIRKNKSILKKKISRLYNHMVSVLG